MLEEMFRKDLSVRHCAQDFRLLRAAESALALGPPEEDPELHRCRNTARRAD